MNHCIDCGRSVTTGRCKVSAHESRCELCKTARRMKTFRYVSPWMKRYYAKKGHSHDHEDLAQDRPRDDSGSA